MKKKQLVAVAMAGVLAAGVLSYGVSAQADGFSTDYTITIPATTFSVGNEDWNYAGNITVAQNADFDTAKKITVKAESAHDWKLTKDNANDGYGGNYVSYTMHNGTADAKGDAATSWEFSADQVRAEGGAAQGIGIDVEKYTVKNLDAGNYQDTVTFTAKVEDAVKVETLLTTLTFGGSSTYSETTSGVVSVTATNVTLYDATYGWLFYDEGSLSVTAKEGYTITKCVFIQNAKTPITDTEAPFEIHSNRGNITEDTKWDMDGVTSIEVYGYAN